MRIRKPTPNSSSSPSSSSLSSSSSSSSYSFSSLTNNSLASSTDSSSSAPSTSTCTTTRCQGLDLLVKAIHLVTAGSVVGVPYIQKRVITRRRRRIFSFDSLFIAEIKCKGSELPKRQQRKQRLKSVPTKYQDSVLIQSSKPKPKSKRLQRSANKICEQLGS
ncbi:hypothetical protein A4A49_15412 [Nicotiana attenuata]|uniref:Uncharacterized protein n=1 Tax=Nicotiana attenuata TaxID=49451 RepID=A0A1J6J498_NICAT|nr:hypothetical protein A4A49_15412 [Nicotiana attenuata]